MTDATPAKPEPTLQTILRVGPIVPDNELNVWCDFTHLLILNARLIHPDRTDTPLGGELYIAFGQKEPSSLPFTSAMSKEDAEKMMVNAYKATLVKKQVPYGCIPDPAVKSE